MLMTYVEKTSHFEVAPPGQTIADNLFLKNGKLVLYPKNMMFEKCSKFH